MKMIATLFSGGGGVEVGAETAGFRSLWGIENDDAIAQVARDNGLPIITADVRTANPADFERPDVLHASPPCPSFSPAKTGGVETEQDIELAQATARFIEVLRPPVFTLENVWQYRKSESWRVIVDTLNRLGYWTQVSHCNAADFGVPQTRKRMVVWATVGQILSPLPAPMPWVGWYGAIEDLVPDLPDDAWAQWQIDRGVRKLTETTLVGTGGYDGTVVMRDADEPAFTVAANVNQASQVRAFLVSGQDATIRRGDEPAYTITAGGNKIERASVSGRVVRLTPRCLARLQTIPDSYVLPKDRGLAVRIIGNAVPPLLMKKLAQNLTSHNISCAK